MESLASEKGPLLPVMVGHQRKKTCRIFRGDFCVQSKAARLILLWNFAVLLAYKFFYDINIFFQVGHSIWLAIVLPTTFTFIAVLSPVAGLLTDIRFSRVKTVLCTSYVVLIKLVIIILFIALLFSIGLHLHQRPQRHTRIIFEIAIAIAVSLMVTVYVMFIVNSIQFGMDQLHDSPTEDSILFVHWYVWIYYTCSLITQVAWNLYLYDDYYVDYYDIIRISGLFTASLISLTILFLLTVSLCVVHYKKVWFFLEPAGVNPYKLVYRVVKFAYQHKVPLRRSAFTYCDEESPTRLDVGKHKFGGPFTTKQVEDVKAFWGILKVLITIGPAFLIQTVMQSLLPAFAKHSSILLSFHNNMTVHHEIHLEGVARHILISNGLLSPLLVVICIPLYLWLIRPHITYYIPGMLKRIQIALVIMVLSLICSFIMDVVVHVNNTEYAKCMFNDFTDFHVLVINTTDFPSSPPLYQNVYFFTTQHVLSALADMLFDIATLEFICSQSPYSMKGLLLGTFFSIRTLLQGIAVVSIVPFGTVWKIESLSCGSGFYAMYIVIGLFEFVLFSCVSKRYKYRNVNEPCNEYRYAEEYYSNFQ